MGYDVQEMERICRVIIFVVKKIKKRMWGMGLIILWELGLYECELSVLAVRIS